MLDASVAEVISKLVSNPKFSDLIRNKINMEVDTSALDQEIENYKIQLRKLYHNKDTILSDMDSLDYEDKHYQRRKTDLENHFILQRNCLYLQKLRNALCWQIRLLATISTRHSFF